MFFSTVYHFKTNLSSLQKLGKFSSELVIIVQIIKRYILCYQPGDERRGDRLPGNRHSAQPDKEVLAVHNLPHLLVVKQGEKPA